MHVHVNGYKKWLQEMATSPTKFNLVVKKNAKSVAWEYFGLEADEKNILKTRAGRSACLQVYKRQ